MGFRPIRKERVANSPMVGDKVRNNLQGTRVVTAVDSENIYYKVNLRSRTESFCDYEEWREFVYGPGGYVVNYAPRYDEPRITGPH